MSFWDLNSDTHTCVVNPSATEPSLLASLRWRSPALATFWLAFSSPHRPVRFNPQWSFLICSFFPQVFSHPWQTWLKITVQYGKICWESPHPCNVKMGLYLQVFCFNVSLCITYVPGACGIWQRASDPPELESQKVVSHHRVLGIEPDPLQEQSVFRLLFSISLSTSYNI